MFKNRDLKGVHITRFICLCVILTKLCQSLKSFEMKSLYTLERCHNEHVLTSVIECKQSSIITQSWWLKKMVAILDDGEEIDCPIGIRRRQTL